MLRARLLSAWTEEAAPEASWNEEHLAHARRAPASLAGTDHCDDLCDDPGDVEATDVVDDAVDDVTRDDLEALDADGEPDDFDADLAIDADESHDAFATDD